MRDFVLNRHEEIKDLDFMLKIEEHIDGSVRVINENFSREELDTVNFNFTENTLDWEEKEAIDIALISLCLNRTKNEADIASNNNRLYKIFKQNILRPSHNQILLHSDFCIF